MLNFLRTKEPKYTYERKEILDCTPGVIRTHSPKAMVIKPPKLHLFQEGTFKSASGLKLDWKIECDALSEWDWEWAAKHISNKFAFRNVYTIFPGGDQFASVLSKYVRPDDSRLQIICDDVLTTGRSMETKKKEILMNDPLLSENDIQGVVLFQRRPTLINWIYPIWRMWN